MIPSPIERRKRRKSLAFSATTTLVLSTPRQAFGAAEKER
jgi:hypothetical protein